MFELIFYGGKEMEIRHVKKGDLNAIIAIEKMGFTKAQAGTKEQYNDRIDKLSDTFLVAQKQDEIVGFIVGPVVNEKYVEDWMYEQTPKNLKQGGNQIIFTIAVHEKYRYQGIGSKLLKAIEALARSNQRKTISLTCLEDKIPFYEKNGFKNHGIADSTHGGDIWYNMVKTI